MNKIKGMLKWKSREIYIKLACFFLGYKLWNLDEHVKFAAIRGDSFSHLLYIIKGHEKVEMKWCENYLRRLNLKNGAVIDCGANIGYFSVVLAQKFPNLTFIAIEGNTETFLKLKKIIKILNIPNVKPINAVLISNKKDTYYIPTLVGKEPWQRAKPLEGHVKQIQNLTLDSAVAQLEKTPCLVKIDCEGFEVEILKGSKELLQNDQVAMMVECNDYALKENKTNRQELFNMLESSGYNLYHLNSFGPNKFDIGVKVSDVTSKEFNFCALPQTKQFFK